MKSRDRHLTKIPTQGSNSLQSKPAPDAATAPPTKIGKLLPAPALQPAVAGRKDPIWRWAWPKLQPAVLGAPDPGLAIMQAVDQIAADLTAHLPTDPYLKRLFVRHEALLREGEGRIAADELRAIDHYIAQKAHGEAQLRRKELRAKGVKVSAASAMSAVTYGPDRKATARIVFSITGRGHEARSAFTVSYT